MVGATGVTQKPCTPQASWPARLRRAVLRESSRRPHPYRTFLPAMGLALPAGAAHRVGGQQRVRQGSERRGYRHRSPSHGRGCPLRHPKLSSPVCLVPQRPSRTLPCAGVVLRALAAHGQVLQGEGEGHGEVQGDAHVQLVHSSVRGPLPGTASPPATPRSAPPSLPCGWTTDVCCAPAAGLSPPSPPS